MPGWVAARIGEALNEHAKPLKGARVLVLGVAYKPDVGDVRESPSLRVMSVLARRGVKLAFHDPFVDAVTVDGRRLARTELTARAVAAPTWWRSSPRTAATILSGWPVRRGCCSTRGTRTVPAPLRTWSAGRLVDRFIGGAGPPADPHEGGVAEYAASRIPAWPVGR